MLFNNEHFVHALFMSCISTESVGTSKCPAVFVKIKKTVFNIIQCYLLL